jgi:hypothetical protein
VATKTLEKPLRRRGLSKQQTVEVDCPSFKMIVHNRGESGSEVAEPLSFDSYSSYQMYEQN